MSRHEQRLLPPGDLRLHTELSAPTNSTYTKEDAARDIAAMNLPDYLRTILNRNVLFGNVLENQGVSQVVVPKSPYAYGSLMVVAADDRLLDPQKDDQVVDRKTGIVPTKTIYDFDPKVQNIYFRQILAGMKAMEGEGLPGEREEQDTPRVIAAENNIKIVSDMEYRVSRSIALPHTQIFRAGSWIETEADPELPKELKLERRIVRPSKYLEKFVNSLSTTMSRELGDTGKDLEFYQRGTDPVGYVITTPIHTGQDVSAQADVLQKIMASHQSAYTDLAKDVLRVAKLKLKPKNFARIIPQPSMRTYFYFGQDGYLDIVISPEIFSSAGIFEAAGVRMNRDPKHPNPYKNGEVEAFRERVVGKMRGILEGSNSVAG